MTTSDAIIELRELIGDARIGMLTTVAPSGEPHSRPLTIGEVDDRGRAKAALGHQPAKLGQSGSIGQK